MPMNQYNEPTGVAMESDKEVSNKQNLESFRSGDVVVVICQGRREWQTGIVQMVREDSVLRKYGVYAVQFEDLKTEHYLAHELALAPADNTVAPSARPPQHITQP